MQEKRHTKHKLMENLGSFDLGFFILFLHFNYKRHYLVFTSKICIGNSETV